MTSFPQALTRPYPPAHRHVDTSEAAAHAIAPRSTAIRADVLRFVEGCGRLGTTADELCEAMGLKIQTATPRLNELASLEQIGDSGERRPTRSGRTAKVWVSSKWMPPKEISQGELF